MQCIIFVFWWWKWRRTEKLSITNNHGVIPLPKSHKDEDSLYVFSKRCCLFLMPAYSSRFKDGRLPAWVEEDLKCLSPEQQKTYLYCMQGYVLSLFVYEWCRMCFSQEMQAQASPLCCERSYRCYSESRGPTVCTSLPLRALQLVILEGSHCIPLQASALGMKRRMCSSSEWEPITRTKRDGRVVKCYLLMVWREMEEWEEHRNKYAGRIVVRQDRVYCQKDEREWLSLWWNPIDLVWYGFLKEF